MSTETKEAKQARRRKNRDGSVITAELRNREDCRSITPVRARIATRIDGSQREGPKVIIDFVERVWTETEQDKKEVFEILNRKRA